MLRLIVDDDLTRTATIVESTETDDRFHPLKLRGIFVVAEKFNRNKRKYRFEELKPEVDKFIEEDIKNRRAFGDFEHPTDGKIVRERAAVTIDRLELNEPEKLWLGEATVMYTDDAHHIKGTPQGDLLKSFIDYGSKVGFSTRGVGTVEGDYVKNFKLVTIDCVCDPSIGEFCEGILESKAFMIDTHGQIVECAMDEFERAVNASVKTFDSKKRHEMQVQAWDKLLNKVKGY